MMLYHFNTVCERAIVKISDWTDTACVAGGLRRFKKEQKSDEGERGRGKVRRKKTPHQPPTTSFHNPKCPCPRRTGTSSMIHVMCYKRQGNYRACNEFPFSTVGMVVVWKEAVFLRTEVRVLNNVTFFLRFFLYLSNFFF